MNLLFHDNLPWMRRWQNGRHDFSRHRWHVSLAVVQASHAMGPWANQHSEGSVPEDRSVAERPFAGLSADLPGPLAGDMKQVSLCEPSI